jgi:ABC-type Fe3+ transport system permease subunit
MLTLAYSIFQGNVGTAYRQRSQILVFYFIFVAVGAVLLKERQEEGQRQVIAQKQSRVEQAQAAVGRRRYAHWDAERGQELEQVAQDIAERINF